MFDGIVVPLDGSENAEVAVGPAVTLASKTGARLSFVSIASAHDAEARGDYLSGIARNTFLPNEIEVAVDAPVADTIIAMTARRAPALLCMTSHARGTLGQAMFGDHAADVVRRLGAPVLVAGPRTVAVMAYSEVIVAVDASDESAAILPHAAALAEKLGLTIEIVQVLDPADAQAAPPNDVFEAGHISNLARTVDATWEVLHNDDPAVGILDHLTEHPYAIVAMATHARSGLSLLAEGSIANRVVHDSTCPVLLVH